LLEFASVDTVPELAQRKPENLHAKMLEVNAERKLVRRPPTLAQVENWVAQAKEIAARGDVLELSDNEGLTKTPPETPEAFG
jgi:hypothetical protein